MKQRPRPRGMIQTRMRTSRVVQYSVSSATATATANAASPSLTLLADSSSSTSPTKSTLVRATVAPASWRSNGLAGSVAGHVNVHLAANVIHLHPQTQPTTASPFSLSDLILTRTLATRVLFLCARHECPAHGHGDGDGGGSGRIIMEVGIIW
ncbi:hypothetical protein K439DRAFT_411129 [Ramaria rubella]|nr:hypothetical protein K439DRAFT_411129 [Ramaria rubella]